MTYYTYMYELLHVNRDESSQLELKPSKVNLTPLNAHMYSPVPIV
jgi:hypothetical protein